MLPNTTQISLKGALEAMITWKTFTMQKSSTTISSKKQDIYHIVMTPDRIPKFIIPSLDVGHVLLHIDPMEDIKDFDRRSTTQQEALSPITKRSHSESNIKKVQLLRGRSLCRKSSDYLSGELDRVVDHSDPSTRAALSLPHLSKIKTPYGFLTLGESPNIRRKESLYFDVDAIKTQSVFPKKNITRSISRNTLSPLRKQVTCKACPSTPKKPARSISLEVLCCTPATSSLSSSNTLEECSSKCEKKKFRLLKWKHFAGGRCFKCNGENKEKVPVTIGRTRSNPIA